MRGGEGGGVGGGGTSTNRRGQREAHYGTVQLKEDKGGKGRQREDNYRGSS